jgi:hypothetical protein
MTHARVAAGRNTRIAAVDKRKGRSQELQEFRSCRMASDILAWSRRRGKAKLRLSRASRIFCNTPIAARIVVVRTNGLRG